MVSGVIIFAIKLFAGLLRRPASGLIFPGISFSHLVTSRSICCGIKRVQDLLIVCDGGCLAPQKE